MANYYFDVETTGLDPKKDKIISIQYQLLDRFTGKPAGELVILREWPAGEKKILENFLNDYNACGSKAFSFVPVGYNLSFEHAFLKERMLANGLPPVDILNNPFIDIRALAILMNKGDFRGCGLDRMTRKECDGKSVPIWYSKGDYERIISYVKNEAESFNELYSWLCKEMPQLFDRFRKEHGI